VYDYFLTLDFEIERFWKRSFGQKPTWSAFLFFTNRYLAPLGYIPIALFNLIKISTMVSFLRVIEHSMHILTRESISEVILYRIWC
jgi:hypothetical protein